MGTINALSPDNTPVFPIGFNVYYFNQWAGFDATKELHKFFTHLTPEETLALKSGDTVWTDREPYYHAGKVYGYTKLKVHSTVILADESIQVDFGPTGFATYGPNGAGRSIAWVHNERALKSTLDQLSHFATQLR